MHSQPPTSFEKEFTAPDKNIRMNPTKCTAISKKTQEHKPPESIVLHIYPFPSTILLQFLIFEKLGYLLDCRQAVAGERPSPLRHTPGFLPPPTLVGRHVGPSLFFHPARAEPMSWEQASLAALCRSAHLATWTSFPRLPAAHRTCRPARTSRRCKAASPGNLNPPDGGWEGKGSVPNLKRSVLVFAVVFFPNGHKLTLCSEWEMEGGAKRAIISRRGERPMRSRRGKFKRTRLGEPSLRTRRGGVRARGPEATAPGPTPGCPRAGRSLFRVPFPSLRSGKPSGEPDSVACKCPRIEVGAPRPRAPGRRALTCARK